MYLLLLLLTSWGKGVAADQKEQEMRAETAGKRDSSIGPDSAKCQRHSTSQHPGLDSGPYFCVCIFDVNGISHKYVPSFKHKIVAELGAQQDYYYSQMSELKYKHMPKVTELVRCSSFDSQIATANTR